MLNFLLGGFFALALDASFVHQGGHVHGDWIDIVGLASVMLFLLVVKFQIWYSDLLRSKRNEGTPVVIEFGKEDDKHGS